MTPAPPLPHETGLLLALQRVRNGRVTALVNGLFADHGDPFPGVLVPFLRELIDHGQARVENDELRRVVITDAGEALFAELVSSTSDESHGDGGS